MTSFQMLQQKTQRTAGQPLSKQSRLDSVCALHVALNATADQEKIKKKKKKSFIGGDKVEILPVS